MYFENFGGSFANFAFALLENLMRSRKTTVKMRVLKIIKLEVIILFILGKYIKMRIEGIELEVENMLETGVSV